MRDFDRDDVGSIIEVFSDDGRCRRVLVTPNQLWCTIPAPDRRAARLHRGGVLPAGKMSPREVVERLIAFTLFALAFALLYLRLTLF